MIDCGLGARQLNNFLSVMGIPGIAENTLKKREREIFKPIVKTAEESCRVAIEKECLATSIETPLKGLAVKYDMCWQKRGSGRSYSSPSGVGTAIGQLTGKVLDFDMCITHCSICKSAEKEKREPREHNCQKNWNKSSKAMESGTGARLMQNIENKSGKTVDTLIMDDDASTLSKVKEMLDHDVDKWSDINHAKKAFGNALYVLKPKHKSLTTEIIKYYQKCFAYAIQQNKNNEDQLKQTLGAITPHSFGSHDRCGSWCKAGNDNFSYKSLPHGKCLSGESLKVHNVHRLAPAGSTKDVESINSMYATKAPQKVCYSTSESLRTRVSATVSQKNIGYNYISHVNAEAGLSPNKVTRNFSDKLSKERKRKLDYSQKPEVKKRRLTDEKSQRKANLQENKEGTTYKSGISLHLITEANEIPGIKYTPQLATVNDFTGSFVTFDLETTSLSPDCDILQIAASSMSSNSTFDCYIQPIKSIPPTTSAVTGLTSKGGVLFYRGRPVDVLTTEVAFQNFVLWLCQHKPVLLVAHNAKSFDSRRLIYNISKYSCYGEFKECVAGFVDTLPMFKEHITGLTSYTQENVYKEGSRNKDIMENA